MSSTSPSKDAEVEPEVQSGEDQEQMDKDQHDIAQGQGEFEVKEQDRWLPIANGKLCLFSTGSSVLLCTYLAAVGSPLPFTFSVIFVFPIPFQKPSSMPTKPHGSFAEMLSTMQPRALLGIISDVFMNVWASIVHIAPDEPIWASRAYRTSTTKPGRFCTDISIDISGTYHEARLA